VIKIDIEGAELMAIRGMRRVLRLSTTRAALVEVTPPYIEEMGGSADELRTLLASAGLTRRTVLSTIHCLVDGRRVEQTNELFERPTGERT
jgi:hypothetical protein